MLNRGDGYINKDKGQQTTMMIKFRRNYALNETTGYPEGVGVENWHRMKGLECYPNG